MTTFKCRNCDKGLDDDTTKVECEWGDFCCTECMNEYIRNETEI